LKRDDLKCPFPLESAYLDKCINNKPLQEILPFTNITHHFVDTLDYIFFDRTHFYAIERLQVPTTFEELSDGRTHLDNAHLLPSDVWPSDHVAIAARLAFHKHDRLISNGYIENSTVRKEDGIVDEDLNEYHINDATTDVTNVKTDSTETDPMLYCGFIGDAATGSVPHAIPPFQGKRPTVHVNDQRCACGCVPSIPSLFEMAELRKQAKLKAAMEK
jgi:hypothetical protein